MARIYSGKRQSGKTTKLIKESAATGAVIVAPTKFNAEYIKTIALKMQLYIPEPISIETFIKEQFLHTSDGKHYLIDELQAVLHHLKIDAATADEDSIFGSKFILDMNPEVRVDEDNVPTTEYNREFVDAMKMVGGMLNKE